MRFNSITFKLLIPLAVVTLGAGFLTVWTAERFLKETVEDVFIRSEEHHFRALFGQRVDDRFKFLIRDGKALAAYPDTVAFLTKELKVPEKMNAELQEKMAHCKKYYNFDTVYVAQATTRHYFDETGFVKTVDPADPESAWFNKTLRSGKPYLVNIDSDITGEMHLWVDAVVGDLRRPLGVAGGGVKIPNIMEELREFLTHYNATGFMLDENGMVRADSKDLTNINKPLALTSFSPEVKAAAREARETGERLVRFYRDGEVHFLVSEPVESLGWDTMLVLSRETFLAPLEGVVKRVIIGGSLLLFFLLMVGSFAITSLIGRPMRQIAGALEEYDYTSPFEPKGCKGMGYEVDMICLALDKSAAMLRKTLQKHESSEKLLRNIMNATDDLIFVKNRDSRYVICNTAYERWCGKSSDAMIGLQDRDIYSEGNAKKHLESDRVVLEEKRIRIDEESFHQPDGSEIVLHVKKSPLLDSDGELIGIVGVARDITSRKVMEKELHELNTTLEARVAEQTEELQESNRMLEKHVLELEVMNAELGEAKEKALQAAQARSNFISSVSHELRTPLNAIINFTDQVVEDFEEMLEDPELQKESRGFLRRVLVNSRHLLQLINELLEFTKAEAGKMDYKIEVQDVNAVVRTSFNSTYSLLAASPVEFRNVLYDQPLMAAVDGRRLLQVLLNLLSNAAKFTDEGFIEVRSFAEGDEVVIEVEDTGRGIPAEKQQTIFDPFAQVKGNDPGTGLGLGLAKRMCDDMQIAITITSVEGKGTIFRLTTKRISKDDA